MEQPKKKPGRPPVENGERRWLSLRVSDERLERYTQAAERAGETLSAWVKRILDRAAKR
jgi:predicted HicB family RNase H-like nuclease